MPDQEQAKDPYEGMTDEDIALLARDGDEAALELLVPIIISIRPGPVTFAPTVAP